MSDELRRRRAVALAALITSFVMLVLAIALAMSSGGDGGGGVRGARTEERKERPRRTTPRRRPQPPAEAAVPASAPGAHKAPDEAVPVLAYNVVNTPKPDTANPEIWVPPEEFEAQMTYLADNGFHPVTMSQVWAAWKDGGLLPSKPIVISFDTGYHSVYQNALPLLRDRKWPATLFLNPAQTRADFPASEVKEMIEAGWELGAQPGGEGDIRAATDDQLEQAAGGTRRTLRREFNRRVDFMAYPDGAFDDRVAAAVEEAGYDGAVTLEEGLATPDDPPFELPRIPLANGDGEEGLAGKLQSAGVE